MDVQALPNDVAELKRRLRLSELRQRLRAYA